MKNDFNVIMKSSDKEIVNRKTFLEMLKTCPIPDDEILSNLGLFINRQTLSRMLFMHNLYKKIINVHGVVIEFGVRWGQNLVLFENFRGMYEPFNFNRKIVGFDTFEGFPEVSDKDKQLKKGAYGVSKDYEEYLKKVLEYHESESPISHIKKHELVKGDASLTLKEYLTKNPETIIALAYFDFDIYKPTRDCLELIKNHLTKGSVIGFDELNVHEFPGETLALNEVFGINKFRIRRSHISPQQSYILFE